MSQLHSPSEDLRQVGLPTSLFIPFTFFSVYLEDALNRNKWKMVI